jgi:hypothetical protein
MIIPQHLVDGPLNKVSLPGAPFTLLLESVGLVLGVGTNTFSAHSDILHYTSPVQRPALSNLQGLESQFRTQACLLLRCL